MHDLLSVDAQRSEQVHTLRYYGSVQVASYESPYLHHKKSIGLIQIVSDLFSLQIGNFILSASSVQSLIEVPNGIFMRLFFFLYVATERKPYQRNDRCFNGTIDFFDLVNLFIRKNKWKP